MAATNIVNTNPNFSKANLESIQHRKTESHFVTEHKRSDVNASDDGQQLTQDRGLRRSMTVSFYSRLQNILVWKLPLGANNHDAVNRPKSIEISKTIALFATYHNMSKQYQGLTRRSTLTTTINTEGDGFTTGGSSHHGQSGSFYTGKSRSPNHSEAEYRFIDAEEDRTELEETFSAPQSPKLNRDQHQTKSSGSHTASSAAAEIPKDILDELYTLSPFELQRIQTAKRLNTMVLLLVQRLEDIVEDFPVAIQLIMYCIRDLIIVTPPQPNVDTKVKAEAYGMTFNDEDEEARILYDMRKKFEYGTYYTSCCALLFLRLICRAIISPDDYGICEAIAIPTLTPTMASNIGLNYSSNTATQLTGSPVNKGQFVRTPTKAASTNMLITPSKSSPPPSSGKANRKISFFKSFSIGHEEYEPSEHEENSKIPSTPQRSGVKSALSNFSIGKIESIDSADVSISGHGNFHHPTSHGDQNPNAPKPKKSSFFGRLASTFGSMINVIPPTPSNTPMSSPKPSMTASMYHAHMQTPPRNNGLIPDHAQSSQHSSPDLTSSSKYAVLAKSFSSSTEGQNHIQTISKDGVDDMLGITISGRETKDCEEEQGKRALLPSRSASISRSKSNEEKLSEGEATKDNDFDPFNNLPKKTSSSSLISYSVYDEEPSSRSLSSHRIEVEGVNPRFSLSAGSASVHNISFYGNSPSMGSSLSRSHSLYGIQQSHSFGQVASSSGLVCMNTSMYGSSNNLTGT